MRAIEAVRVAVWVREESKVRHVPPPSKDEWRNRCFDATGVPVSFDAIAEIAEEIGIVLEVRPRVRMTNDDLLKALVFEWDKRNDAGDDRFADLMEDLRGRVYPSESLEAECATANADKDPVPDSLLPI